MPEADRPNTTLHSPLLIRRIITLHGDFVNAFALAAIISGTGAIFILLLAALLLRETITRRKVVASTFAVAGILMVTPAPGP